MVVEVEEVVMMVMVVLMHDGPHEALGYHTMNFGKNSLMKINWLPTDRQTTSYRELSLSVTRKMMMMIMIMIDMIVVMFEYCIGRIK